MIDLRSDTFTQPTPEMRKAMYAAECGDDVWGEDPTVNHLQEIAASLLGKPAALFTASGTMSNLLAILSWCNRGDTVIGDSESHIFQNEFSGASSLAGVQFRSIPSDTYGRLDPSGLDDELTSRHSLPTDSTLVTLENTHNRYGGLVLKNNHKDLLVKIARNHHSPIHLDGARIFNAAVYLDIAPSDLAEGVDSISFCLSKGLCAPVGSLLCGSDKFIADAREWRQMVGGGMRQSGIIAAAGVIALQTMIDRLSEDHRTAAQLSSGLFCLPGISIDPEKIQTNIVIFQWLGASTTEFISSLKEKGVRVSSLGNNTVRMVTHNGITESHVKSALMIVKKVTGELAHSESTVP